MSAHGYSKSPARNTSTLVVSVVAIATAIGVLVPSPDASASTPAPSGDTYTPIVPTRICDTRPGNPSDLSGSYAQCEGKTLGPNTTLDIQVSGIAPIPSSASAVVANLTVTNTTAASYLTAYPTGSTLPTASNLNWSQGQSIANSATLALGSGQISIYNASGDADVIVDIEGYYTAAASGDTYTPIVPTRICDTRPGNPSDLSGPYAQCEGKTLGPNTTLDIQVSGIAPIPSSASAVVANLTVTNTTAAGYLTAYPTGSTLPTASNLNWSQGQSIANSATLALGSGQISIYNASGDADVIVDIEGYYTAAASGDTYTPIVPTRIADTRWWSLQPEMGDPLGQASTLQVPVANTNGDRIPSSASAVVANLTVTNTTAASYLTAYPTESTRPTASNLNWSQGQSIANSATLALGSGQISIYNASGDADVIVDAEGYFAPAQASVPLVNLVPPSLSAPNPHVVDLYGEPSNNGQITLVNTAGSTNVLLILEGYTIYNAPIVPFVICDTEPGNPLGLSGVEDQCDGKTLGPNQSLNIQVGGDAGEPTDFSGESIQVDVLSATEPGSLIFYPYGSTTAYKAQPIAWATAPYFTQDIMPPAQTDPIVATPGTWSFAPSSYGYSWSLCELTHPCEEIPGATAAVFTPTGAIAQGSSIELTVTATAPDGQSVSATSPPVPLEAAHVSLSAAEQVNTTTTDPTFNPPGNDPTQGFSGCFNGSPLFSNTSYCTRTYMETIDADRSIEHLPPLVLPSNWSSLSNGQQQFVYINLERTARGLRPIVGINATLSTGALDAPTGPFSPAVCGYVPSGADGGGDPCFIGPAAEAWMNGPGRLGASAATAGFFAGFPGWNVLAPMLGYFYDDGCSPFVFGANLDCLGPHPSDPTGWSHRDGFLEPFISSSCGPQLSAATPDQCDGYIGTASGTMGIAELLYYGSFKASTTFTWEQELQYLPPCERAGDVCTALGG